LCFSHLRKRRVRRAGSLDEMDGEPPAMGVGDVFDPEMIAERNEAKDRVWKAISQLDEKHREVIVLRHFRNLSYDEMAKVLFCNRGTVTSRLYYARKRLKDMLDRESGSSDVASDGELRKGGQT
jgi:RNA polymerase sigma-70 factor (ECF subfamily)